MILRLLGITFCLLPFYWAYLVYSTQPVLVFDAIGYEKLGQLLLDKGWAGYFTGLRREPLFPLLISWAMGIERASGIPYTVPLKCFLMLFLAVAMAGTYRLTRMLGATRTAAGLAALYLGISPAILNSTLWLWSEAAAYPWVVWIVFVTVRLWRTIRDPRAWIKVAGLSVLLAVLFFLLTMVKAIAATLLVFYLLPFCVALFWSAFQKQWARAGRAALAVSLVLVLVGAAVHGYKWLNWRNNGQYELTDRGDFALFGNTVRRLQPMTRARIGQALLSVPRLGLCERVYGSDCVYWTYVVSDRIFDKVRRDLTALGLSAEERSRFFITNSIQLMAEHPFQQAFFMAVEAGKMLFWENRLFFVVYPPWLANIYSQPFLIYLLCFTWAVFSLVGVGHAAWYLIVRCARPGRSDEAENTAAWLFVLWFIVCFAGLYSIFFIDIRYALPIAPLFVALFMGWSSRMCVSIGHNVR